MIVLLFSSQPMQIASFFPILKVYTLNRKIRVLMTVIVDWSTDGSSRQNESTRNDFEPEHQT